MSLRLSLTVLVFWFSLSHAWAQSNKLNVYDSLYAKAYRMGNAQPDSAIHYAQLALKITQDRTKQANAHNLIAFYAQCRGYYGFSLSNYQKAYDLYSDLTQKAVMLKNMAFCHYNAGKHSIAIPIAQKAIDNFRTLGDTKNHNRALQVLANSYYNQNSFYAADTCFRQLVKTTQSKTRLASIYTDLASFKESQQKYDSAVYYQQLALSLGKASPSKESIRRVKLAWYYLQSKNLAAAEQSLQQAQSITHRSPKAWAYYWGLQGLVHYVKIEEKAATQAYQKFDSLLQVLGGNTAPPIQQNFANKTAYDMYSSGYALIGRIWPKDEHKVYFERIRQWYALQKQAAHRLMQSTEGLAVLQDSLVIERAKPKIEIIKKINPWWWVVLVAAIAIAAIWVYKARRLALQAQAHFMEAVEASPVKGFGEVSKAEVSMLAEAEYRLKRKLRLEEVQLLMMVSRGYKYSEIGVNLGIKETTARMRMQRLRERLDISNINDLMQ
jgi:tetratricopeptide (TPR) repeat protein